MLELKGITKTFGRTSALAGVDLQIATGRTVVLIGPSGCGKSTLLRLMIGLIIPDTGRVRFAGQEVGPDASSLRHRMGYVIQSGGLFPHLTARDNVSLQAEHLRWQPARIAARTAELAQLTSFPAEALDRYPVQLSGGQQQRVGLMRALMLDPDVLLLDEPLAALDPLIRSDLQLDLRRIFQSLGKTVVMVTHDLAEARYFADQIVLLDDGRIVQQGSFIDLLEAPSEPFVTRFIQAQRTLHGQLDGPDP